MPSFRGFTFVVMLTALAGLPGQDRAIEFPDVPGYRTLVVDLHTHSVFSDGEVWPSIRVEESRRDGLDLMAVTEHLEYQPYEDDIPHPDRNRSFDLALEYAGDRASAPIIVNGAEVTQDMPPGHVNAVFLTDANALLVDDPLEAFREANRQGAFVFWNHPSWTGQRDDGIAVVTEMHETLIAEGMIHGIEVANGPINSEESLQIALDYNLTILGVSDVHGLIDWEYDIHDEAHRTVTLVFARERTAESIQEALHAGRTVAWVDNTLIGHEEVLLPLIEASLTVTSAWRRGETTVVDVTLSNASDATFMLAARGHNFYDQTALIQVPAHGELTVGVTGEAGTAFDLSFDVLNALTAPDTHPVVRLPVRVR